MCSSDTAQFRKSRTCPSAETLLFHHLNNLVPEEQEQTAAHLATCDFCNAELQLLAQHPLPPAACAQAPIPEHLRLLAEELLTKNARSKQRLVKMICERSRAIAGE